MFINNCCVYCCVNYFGGGAGLVVRWAVIIKRGWVLFEALLSALGILTSSEVGQLCLDLAGGY